MRRRAGATGLGVYVHLPWCLHKCPYCDFNSHVAPAVLPQQQYVAAVLRDLDMAAAAIRSRPVTTIFFGGGTPSLFDGPAVGAMLRGVRERLNVIADAEVTLEANPGAVDAERFAGFREAGVNRLSLGAQSFDDRSLKALGRIHTSAAIHAAWRSAAAAGFDNINLDLMYGLPGQSTELALEDVEIAVALGVSHVSHYQLTLEPQTAFFRDPPPLPEEEQVLAMEGACRRRLREAGYRRYEISAFARPGREARHNLNYWRFGDYLGLGAGAHSKLTIGRSQRRIARRRNPHSYMRHAGTPRAIAETRHLSDDDLTFEFMLNRLRLTTPLAPGEFEAATGQAFDAVLATLEGLAGRGLMRHTAQGWTVSSRGRQLLNEVLLEFLAVRPALCTAGS